MEGNVTPKYDTLAFEKTAEAGRSFSPEDSHVTGILPVPRGKQ
jgi:hypothetical protein